MLEREIEAHVALLRSKDAGAAYASLLALEELSRDGEDAAAWFDEFAALMGEKSGFLRTRGRRLVIANAAWVEKERLEAALPALLAGITDPKPIAARQCIQALPGLAHARPDLAPRVAAALGQADFSGCRDTVRPLLEADRAEALGRLRAR